MSKKQQQGYCLAASIVYYSCTFSGNSFRFCLSLHLENWTLPVPLIWMADQNLMRGKGKENCFPELHNHHLTVIRLALHPERFCFDIGPPIFENPPFRMIHKKYGLSFFHSLHVLFKKVTIILFKRRCFIVWWKLYVRHRMLQKTMINHVGAPGGVFNFQNKTTYWKWWGCWKKHFNPTPIKTYVVKNLQTRQLHFFSIRKDKRFGDLNITCIGWHEMIQLLVIKKSVKFN